MPTLHWAGRVGHGRHGGEAPALWGGPMMSALILWHFLIKEKVRKVVQRCRRLRVKPAMTAWGSGVVLMLGVRD